MTDPVTIGSAVVAHIEPAAGEAAAFNVWYERDRLLRRRHGRTGHVRGRVLGRDPVPEDARLPGRLFGDPARGSYLADLLAAAGVASSMGRLGGAACTPATPPSASSRAREHLHTAVYDCDWDLRGGGAPAPATALDHGFAGVIAIATTGDAHQWRVTSSVPTSRWRSDSNRSV